MDYKFLRFKAVTLASTAVASIAIASSSIAAERPAGQTAETQAEADNASEEIVVTAAKRNQTLADVTISVSVVSEEEIQKAEIRDIIDLQSRVPSLQVNQRNLSSQTNFVIRGFGNGANNVGIEPSVGFFIDGVYRSRSASSLTDFIDVARVEVLRGPQSTLFGKNASAGVVSVVTQLPSSTFEGRTEVSYGNYDALKLSGTISGPLGNGISARLSANFNKRDGFIRNAADGADLNDRNRIGVRGKLLFEPSDRLKILVAADYERATEICCGFTNLVLGPTGPVIAALGGNIIAADPYSYRTSLTTNPKNRNRLYGFSGQIDFDAGAVDIVSITAFRKAKTNTFADVDLTDLEIIRPNLNGVDIGTFTQEVRLTSKASDSPFSWFMGAYFFSENIKARDELRWGQTGRSYVNALLSASGASLSLLETLTGNAQGSFFGNAQGIVVNATQDNTAYSVFGVVDWEPVDGLKATLGGNYTHDSKDVSQSGISNDSYSLTDLSPLTPLIGAGAVRTLQGLQIFPKFLDFPNAVEDGKTRDGKFTYSARLAYDVTSNINVFASIGTGFKASSWNVSRDSRPLATDFPAIVAAGLRSTNLNTGSRFARPETARVIEIGVKGFFKNFRFTTTLFDQQIKDFQTFVFLGSSFSLANAEKRSAKGFEFDFSANLSPSLTIWGAGTFLDPKYDSYTQSAFGDLSGTVPSQIPKQSITVGASYAFNLGSTEFDIQGDYHYQSNSAFEDNPTLQAAIGTRYFNEQNQFNLSVSAKFQPQLSVRLWARNILNDKSLINFAIPTPLQTGSYSGLPGMPRTYGITISKEF